MHPILERPSRLFLYLVVVAAFGALLVLLFEEVAPGGLAAATTFALPMALIYGFQCLAVWYPVRQLPSERAMAPRLVFMLLVASFAMAAVWTAIGWLWARGLAGAPRFAALPQRFDEALPLFFVFGVVLFVVAALVHFLFAVVERGQAAERRALELQVHAREAELKSLKQQLDPHFLFNSLNSVSALIGSDPKAARRMCYLMAGFFRKSLGLGQREQIPLSEELYLAETYLAIEEVRFGERLKTRLDVAEETLTFAVPPLVLQPLIENAVHHGIAHLIDGGEVTVRAARRDDLLELAVENPCDPERPTSRGAGVGLANVKARVEALFGHRARLDIEAAPERYRVRLLLPATPAA